MVQHIFITTIEDVTVNHFLLITKTIAHNAFLDTRNLLFQSGKQNNLFNFTASEKSRALLKYNCHAQMFDRELPKLEQNNVDVTFS